MSSANNEHKVTPRFAEQSFVIHTNNTMLDSDPQYFGVASAARRSRKPLDGYTNEYEKFKSALQSVLKLLFIIDIFLFQLIN